MRRKEEEAKRQKEEVELLSLRATLYHFEPAVVDWVQKGVGNARLVKHGITGKVRFEVRQENTLQILCNFLIVPDRELSPLLAVKAAGNG